MQYVDAFHQDIEAFSEEYDTAFLDSKITPEDAIKACLAYFLEYPDVADQ